MAMGFPENGVYICKPSILTADERWEFPWGDSVRVTPSGAQRMGRAPHGLVVTEDRPFTDWPQDVTVVPLA